MPDLHTTRLDRQVQAKDLDGCEWIQRERRFSFEKADNPCAGLLYGKFVCDMPAQSNLSEEGHFTYADSISYMGCMAWVNCWRNAVMRRVSLC